MPTVPEMQASLRETTVRYARHNDGVRERQANEARRRRLADVRLQLRAVRHGLERAEPASALGTLVHVLEAVLEELTR